MAERIRKKRKYLRLDLLLLICLIFTVIGAYRWSNMPAAQKPLADWISRVSTWKVESGNWHWNFWGRTFELNNVNLVHKDTGNSIHVGHLDIHYHPTSLLRVRLNIGSLNASDVVLNFPTRVPRDENAPPKKIKLSRLLLLKNLEINNARFRDFSMTLSKDRQIIGRDIDLNYQPSYIGDISLTVQTGELQYKKEDGKFISIGTFDLQGKTDVNKWYSEPPFVNAINGTFNLNDVKHPKMVFKRIDTKMSYEGESFKLDTFDAIVGENHIKVKGAVDIAKESYDLELSMPDPIRFPSFAEETKFLDTGGTVSGKLTLKGKGFKSEKINAKIMADLKHIPAGPSTATLIPIALHAEANIAKGVAQFANTSVRVGDGGAVLKGTLDLVRKNLSFDFTGSNIPLESFFGRFTDPHFHPISGKASVKGTFNGWAKKFHLNLAGDVLSGGGYYDIRSENTHVTLDFTYDKLELKGQLLQGGRTTGDCTLLIKYGGLLSTGVRAKQFTFNAKLNQHNLLTTMAAYKLKGIGSGDLTLSGSPGSFKGVANVSIADGDFFDQKFKLVKSQLTFVPRKITYQNSSVQLVDFATTDLPNPIVMDFIPEGFRFSGQPRSDLSVDAIYNTHTKNWRINRIAYTSPLRRDCVVAASGTYGVGGNVNLKVGGLFDLSLLQYLKSQLREAKGTAQVNLTISGNMSDPSINGEIAPIKSIIYPRAYAYYLEDLEGKLVFQGHQINFNGVHGMIEDGKFSINGWIKHAKWAISDYNINFSGSSLLFATEDRGFKMEFDCNVNWTKNAKGSNLTGDVNIIDARYTKDFNITDSFGGFKSTSADRAVVAEAEGWDNVNLGLRIKSGGDILIHNNVGKIWLRSDIYLKGTRAAPQMNGAIELVEGKIHYIGMDFEMMKGAVEFRAPYGKPFIEMAAERDISNYTVTVQLRGELDRIQLELYSNPPLERHDIISLMTVGMTKDEAKESKFGSQIGASVAAQQVSKILARPITELTHLDIFRIESTSPTEAEVSRLYIGKNFSDRLSLEFITDINTSDARQTVQAEYLLTDWLLLKGSTSSGPTYRVTVALRFRER